MSMSTSRHVLELLLTDEQDTAVINFLAEKYRPTLTINNKKYLYQEEKLGSSTANDVLLDTTVTLKEASSSATISMSKTEYLKNVKPHFVRAQSSKTRAADPEPQSTAAETKKTSQPLAIAKPVVVLPSGITPNPNRSTAAASSTAATATDHKHSTASSYHDQEGASARTGAVAVPTASNVVEAHINLYGVPGRGPMLFLRNGIIGSLFESASKLCTRGGNSWGYDGEVIIDESDLADDPNWRTPATSGTKPEPKPKEGNGNNRGMTRQA